MSIPFVFQPHILHFRDSYGKRYPRPDLGRFVDGGLLNNFPLETFDKPQYQRGLRGERYLNVANRRTLGLCLKDVQNAPLKKKREGLLGLLESVGLIYFYAEELIRKSREGESRVITIPIEGVSLFDFSLTSEQRDKLMKAGEDAVLSSSVFKSRSFESPIKKK